MGGGCLVDRTSGLTGISMIVVHARTVIKVPNSILLDVKTVAQSVNRSGSRDLNIGSACACFLSNLATQGSQ